MAEALTVVGAVASTLQLMEYTIRVFDRINHYVRQVDETPEMLRYVGLHLQFFIQSLQRVQDHIDYGHFNPQTSSMIKMFIDECYSQMILLDDIMTKITPVNGDSKMTRSLRAMESLKQEKALEKIVSRISSYVEKLLLFQNAVISGSTMANTKLVLKQWENAGHPWLPLTTDSLPAGGGEELVADTRDTLVQNKKTSVSSEGLLIPSMQCKKRRFSYFLGLTRLGLLWAFQAGLDISWGNGISIIPSLHLQPLVKHTSAGFQVVYNCYTSQLGLRSSSDALLRLFQTGRISPQDVFPDGVTWLERLLMERRYDRSMVLAFVKILCQCGAAKKTQTPLLSHVVGWNHLGIHIDLLAELLVSGYDCSIDTYYTDHRDDVLEFLSDQPLGFCEHPSIYGNSEPFLLKFLTECSKNAYGVWGQTALMDSVLSGSKDHISILLQNPLNLHGKNVFGQTAAHLAVLRPGTLSMILQMHADFDVTDLYGNSPLVYAAAYGCTESVILLLNAGANPLTDGHLRFLQYAVTWHHWNLVTRVLAFFRSHKRFSDAFLQNETDQFMIESRKHLERRRWWWNWPWLMSAEFLRQMFDLGVDKNLIFSDGSSLLHHAMYREWVDALFDSGFDNIEQSDDEGNTALLKFADSFTVQYDLVEHLLSRNCNVNHRNKRGGTALGMACRQFFLHFVPSSQVASKQIPRYLTMIVRLVAQNADTQNSDNCRCWCAPNGCHPLLQLLRHNERSVGYLWMLECLMILEEIQGISVAQKVLLDLKRVSEFEAAGMTHVCCRCHQTETDDFSVNEILGREKELAKSLDKKMRDITFNDGNTSIQESWLGILANFRVPDKSPKREKYWRTWNPAIGHSNEMIPLGSRSLTGSETWGLGAYKIVEEKDQFWELTEATSGHRIPQSELYSAWVEWVFQDPNSYYSCFPIDRNWYEKREYWAARQAEVLELSS